MTRSKKVYKESLATFCSAAWLQINTTKDRGTALRRGIRDAVCCPLEAPQKGLKDVVADDDALPITLKTPVKIKNKPRNDQVKKMRKDD